MNDNLLQYAIVENGIIINVAVFEDEETAKQFGALPISDNQWIGDTYIPPEEPVELPPVPLENQLKAVSDRQEFLEDCIAEMATQVYS